MDQLSTRRHLILGASALFVLVMGFGLWAVNVQIAGAVVVSGRVEVVQDRQVIQHPDGGVVAEVFIEEGDWVEAGAPLIMLEDNELRPQIAVLESQLYELMSRRGRLESEQDDLSSVRFDPKLLQAAASGEQVREMVEGQQRLFAARRASIEQGVAQRTERKAQIANQITGFVAQQEALERQLHLLAQEIDNQNALRAKGLVQASRLLGLQREEARLAGQLGELRAEMAQAKGRSVEIEMEIAQLLTGRREDVIATLRDLHLREREIAENLADLKTRLHGLTLRAPISGSVHALSVHAEKTVIRAAEPLMYLVPDNRPLVIIAPIDPLDIDQVHPGQTVVLRFSALDQNATPELTGAIRNISADVFRDEVDQQVYYRAQITVSEEALAMLPDHTKVIPGMPIESFIKTEDRTLLAYLAGPFTGYFLRAFRES